MSDTVQPAADAPPVEPPAPPPTPPITARSDPEPFVWDLQALAEFVEKLRAAGVRTFEHPCGLRFAFEPTQPRLPPTW